MQAFEDSSLTILLQSRFLAGCDTRSSVEKLALITARVHGQLQEGSLKTSSNNRVIGLVPFGIRMPENCKALCLLICESHWHLAFSQLLLGV